MEKETLGKRVEVVAAGKTPDIPSNKPRSDAEQELIRSITSVRHARTRDELDECRVNAQRIAAQAAKLKEELSAYRDHLAARKAALETRRGQLKQAASNFSTLREQQGSTVKRITTDVSRAYEQLYPHIVERRIHLCRNAASLARLRRTRKPWSGNGDDKKSFEYSIGGLVIPDLREMHNFEKTYDEATFPAHLTAVFTNICRLLHLVCRYLQLRLPAEITVPHRNWPQPSIFAPSASYSGKPHSFPTGSPGSSRASRTELDNQRTTGRPRPLFSKRGLVEMKLEDATTYSLFIEGVTLLAWDVAWLCRAQGLPVASSKWEDVCAIGPNLWTLLIETPSSISAAPSESRRASSGSAVKDELRVTSAAKPTDDDARTSAPSSTFGRYSHGSSYNFLKPGWFPISNADGNLTHGWAFASPVKIQHELKAYLRNEEIGQGWEFTDINEADMLMDGQAQLATEAQRDGIGKDAADGAMTRVKGMNGWTKLKSRISE